MGPKHSPTSPVIPDVDDEGSEWGWSDWDGLDDWELREIVPRKS